MYYIRAVRINKFKVIKIICLITRTFEGFCSKKVNSDFGIVIVLYS